MLILQADRLKMRETGPSANTVELADLDLIHSISVELIGEQDRAELCGKIVDAAMAIAGAQFGTMQLLRPRDDARGHGGELELLCHRGLAPADVDVWQWVNPAAFSSCTMALKFGQRAIVSDFETWDDIAGTDDLEAFRRAGIRSAQTTPLIARNGSLLGMISTHWRDPHDPTDRDLRLLDILARQAADLLERTIAEEALRESERLQKMLTGELSHRVKNMLATVQAIATQTLQLADDPANFVESFGGRIQSMARVHSQLSTNDWKGTQLRAIVRDQMDLGPVDESQITAQGPDVYLDATAVPKMAMILHELGTNSLKYGALSRKDGSVAIGWAIDGQVLAMRWSEQGGPRIEAPVRRGFGSRLIEASVRGAGGSATMRAEPDGVCWEIRFPLPAGPVDRGTDGGAVADASASTPGARRRDGLATAPLEGKRILLVEDEPLLAMDLTGQLEEAGAQIIGPAADIATALELIGQYRVDAALLDANLDGHPVDAIAEALTEANVPFSFITGYGRQSLPAGFEDARLLAKPFNRGQLLGMAGKLLI